LTPRRLSQAISEGDGISVIVAVDGPEAARGADEAGAEAVLVHSGQEGKLSAIRGVTDLPILFFFDGQHAVDLDGVDACLVDVLDDDRGWLDHLRLELGDRFELAPRICNEQHLEFVLDALDPEILVLGVPPKDEAALEGVLDLLPDVPAGKLAIADAGARTREEVVELERAGVDGVIVGAANVADLVGAAPPEV